MPEEVVQTIEDLLEEAHYGYNSAPHFANTLAELQRLPDGVFVSRTGSENLTVAAKMDGYWYLAGDSHRYTSEELTDLARSLGIRSWVLHSSGI